MNGGKDCWHMSWWHVEQQKGGVLPNVQKDEKETKKAPIADRNRGLPAKYTIDQELLSLSLAYLKGEYRFGVRTRLTQPLNVFGFQGLSPSEFSTALTLGNDCNRAFQNAILQIQYRQRDGERILDFSRNETVLSGGVRFRAGSTTINPRISLGFLGSDFDSVFFTLTIVRGVSTRIPVACIPKAIPPALDPPVEPKSPVTLNPFTINFYYDSTLWVSDSNQVMKNLIDLLKISDSTHVLLIGHASLEGTEAHNQGLSERRANAVKHRLVIAGIDENRIKTRGIGETSPVALEPDMPRTLLPRIEELRTVNRRVEAILVDLDRGFQTNLALRSGNWSLPQGMGGFYFREGIAEPGQ